MSKQPYEIKWTLSKYDAADVAQLSNEELELVTPKEVIEIDGNAMLTQGRDVLNALMLGQAAQAFTNAVSLIHVGDSSTSVAPNQTDLLGSGTYNDTVGTPHKWKKGMEAGFPQVITASGALRFKARFVSAEANFAWNEFGVSNGSILFNRKVASPSIGTKTTEDEWVFSVELLFS